MKENIEDYNFNITYDFYKNFIYVEPLNNKFDEVLVNILDQDKNSIYSESIKVNLGITHWFELYQSFTKFNNIIVEISDKNGLITSENIKIKTKSGIVIKPVILKIINKIGLGDQMWLSPSIRKLYQVYGRKVIVSSSRESYNWGNYLYSSYKEFLKNNRYVNYLIDSEDIINEDYYDIFNAFDNKDNYIWLDVKKLVSTPFNLLLNDDEMNLDYIPDRYIPINLPEKYVCINPYITGLERSWEKEKWQELVNLLNDSGIYVVSIGKFNYYNLDIKLGIDLAGTEHNTMSQTWHIINKSEIFVSFDCGMYILAGTTDTHILLLGWYCDEKYHRPKQEKHSCVRGNCEIYCATNMNSVFETYGSMKDNCVQLKCFLDINYKCKPTPIQTFEEIKKIKNIT